MSKVIHELLCFLRPEKWISNETRPALLSLVISLSRCSVIGIRRQLRGRFLALSTQFKFRQKPGERELGKVAEKVKPLLLETVLPLPRKIIAHAVSRNLLAMR